MINLLLYIEPVVYACIAGYVYFSLIPAIGFGIAERCLENRHCSHFYRPTNLPLLKITYLSDSADNQWREFRASIHLVLLAIMCSVVAQLWLGRFRGKRSSLMFHTAFGLILLWVQHRWHSFVVLSLIGLTFVVAKVNMIKLRIPI